jgi:hypothetical protein
VETNRENKQILTANSIEQNNVIESLQAQIVALTTAVTTATPTPAQANLLRHLHSTTMEIDI